MAVLAGPRRGLFALVIAAALLAVVAADGWRWHLGAVGDLAGAQSLWALGAFVFAVLLSRGRMASGVITGAAFGGVAIIAYYVYEWLAYDAHAAIAQLQRGGGPFWIVAAVLGGAVCGLLGAWAARRPSRRRLDLCALGWTFMAAVPVGELAMVLPRRNSFGPGALLVPGFAMVAVAVVLVALGVRRAGWRRIGVAAVVVLVVAPIVGLAFVAAELNFAYVTLQDAAHTGLDKRAATSATFPQIRSCCR
jgi:hypothetical protein